jgi:beta-lactamase regulating signal transducer with metallopeptidase domain
MADAGTALGWFLHTVAGGGLLLLIAWAAMRPVRAPARRQRLGEWAIAAAIVLSVLSLAPAWLTVPLPSPEAVALVAEPLPTSPADPQATPQPPAPAPAAEAAPWVPDNFLVLPPPPLEPAPAGVVEQHETPETIPAAAPETAPWTAERVAWLALAVYGCGALIVLGRWVLGHLALWRLLRRAVPAQGRAARLFAQMSTGPGRDRLLVSRQARGPFSCGLVRPAVVLPTARAEQAPESVLRWVLAHELTHLERRDARAAALFGLGQVLYFFLPWFWWLRRQVRLCQEFLADAAAARLGQPEDYAEFLVGWTAVPTPPVGAAGVSGPCSDLFRRIAMLLHNPTPLEPRCPRRWSALAAVGLLGLAVSIAGVGLGVQAAPAPSRSEPRKEEPKKDEPKKEEPKKDEGKEDVKKERPARELPANPLFPGVEEMMKRLPPGMDVKEIERMRRHMEEAQKEMERFMQGMRFGQAGAFAGLPGFPGARGDGREQRLGANVAKPSETLADQLDLPRDQGVVLHDIMPNSPADKAGLKAHDILLELNGKPVSSNVEEAARLIAGIKADTPVDAVVLRKGKRETVKGLSMPEAKAVKPEAGLPFFPGAGNFPAAPLVPPLPAAGFNPFGAAGLAGAGLAGAGGAGVMTTTFRSGDRFTTRHQEGSLVITVTGKVADGKSTVGEIRVQDGRESHKYSSVDKVPEEYRDKVKNLVEMTEKSNVRIEIQPK